jgi:hypothetical protein
MAGRRRIHKAWWVLGIVLVLLGILATYLHWPVDNRIIVSRQTTYIEGPLNPDGTVNYVAALDAILAEGVTSENNAAPELIQALGPRTLDPATRSQTLRRLGMDELPADGNYFQAWDEWAEANPKWFASATQPATGKRVNRPAYYGRDSNAMNAPWKEADDPALAAWLRDNELPMQLLTAASRRSRYYIPLISKGKMLIEVGGDYPKPLLLRYMCESIVIRAMKRLGEGDRSGAWEDILTQARLGRLISQSPATMAAILGYAIDNGAWKEGLDLLSVGQVSAQDARNMLADLVSLPPLQTVASMFGRAERFMALDVVLTLSRGGRPQGSSATSSVPSSVIDWNRILRDINAHYDKQVAILNLPAVGERLAGSEELAKVDSKWRSDHSGKMAVAKVILYRLGGRATRGRLSDAITCGLGAILFPNAENLAEEAEIDQTSIEFFKAACALHAYRAVNGRYPASLEELSPACLKQAPLDRFSDKPLIYKPKADGYVLYSVGPNMKDEGGKGDDIAVEMPRKTVGGD